MTVPVLILMLAAMVAAMTASLQDHAALAGAQDLAELRAEHAAGAFVASCLTDAGCAAPDADGIEACADDAGVAVTAQVSWHPTLWKGIGPSTAHRVVAYRQGVAATDLRARALAALDPC